MISKFFHIDEENIPQSDIAISLAKQEIGVGNIDPLIAQKRALLVCKMEQLQKELNKTKVNSSFQSKKVKYMYILDDIYIYYF